MCLGSEKIKQELTILKDEISRQDITIDQAIRNLRSILIKISEASLKKINFASDHSKKKTKRKLNEWFDDECRDFKKTVNKNRKRFQEAIRNNYPNTELIRLKSEYFNSLKIFNKIKKRKENNYWKIKKEHLRTLKTENPKDFWRKLKLKHSGIETNFSKAELFNYFSKLASDGTSQVKTAKLQVDPNRTTTTPCESSESNMKNGKAAGIDKIVPELIKALDLSTLEIIVHILNSILDSGIFPEEWTVGVIVILYKDGEKSDLNNYRGITLLSMLGKILVGVLNNRLSEFVAQADILLENQCGFRKGYQTSDQIFTLFSLIDYYINKKRKKLFLCFVDFRKAFDKVEHTCLWNKLIQYKINGKFLRLIKSMYERVKSCVRSNYGLTEFFRYKKGVRQGCLLSPLLFALFLNDLETDLKEGGAKGVYKYTNTQIQICKFGIYKSAHYFMRMISSSLLRMKTISNCRWIY